MSSQSTVAKSHVDADIASKVLGSWRAWVVCLSAALFFFYEFIQMQMFNAINTQLRADFGVNATELGWLSSAYLFADIFFLIPAGYILDRLSTRMVIVTATAVCVVGTFGFALSESVITAGLYRFFSGFGHSFCFLSCYILVSRWFPARQQAFLIGIVVTMAFLGGMLAQTPLALLSEAVGWRNALLLDGVLGIFITAIIYMLVRDYPEEMAEEVKAQIDHNRTVPFIESVMEAVKNLQNWFAGLYTAFFNLPIMVLSAIWGSAYLNKLYGLDTTQATMVSGMIFIGSIFGCPLVGYWSDKVGKRKQPMVIGGICSLATILLIVMMHHWSFSQLMFLFFALGFFTSTQVISYPLIAESNSKTVTGLAAGLAAVLIMGLGLVAQPLFGWIMDISWTGEFLNGARDYSAAAFEKAMWIFPVTFVLGLFSVWACRETLTGDKCAN